MKPDLARASLHFGGGHLERIIHGWHRLSKLNHVTVPVLPIIEKLERLDDWEDRYRHVIELGKAMPEMDDALKVPATKVEGCASQVWLHASDDAGRLQFQGDSDAMIVKGLIAVLLSLYNGLTPEEARAIDTKSELERLNLTDHLSSQRSNGLRAMVDRIQATAARA